MSAFQLFTVISNHKNGSSHLLSFYMYVLEQFSFTLAETSGNDPDKSQPGYGVPCLFTSSKLAWTDLTVSGKPVPINTLIFSPLYHSVPFQLVFIWKQDDHNLIKYGVGIELEQQHISTPSTCLQVSPTKSEGILDEKFLEN